MSRPVSAEHPESNPDHSGADMALSAAGLWIRDTGSEKLRAARQTKGDDRPMATKTLELMVFYYPNATKRGDVKYAQELVRGAGKIFAPYDIQIRVWPPGCEPYPGKTVVDRVSSDCPLNEHPLADAGKDTLEIVNWIIPNYRDSLVKRLLVVFGRFGNTAFDAEKFPDGRKLPKTELPAFVFVDPQYASHYSEQQRSIIAHEIGHAAGLEHEACCTNVMYGTGDYRSAQPTLYKQQVEIIRSAFFAW
jgi:hypothetical protein